MLAPIGHFPEQRRHTKVVMSRRYKTKTVFLLQLSANKSGNSCVCVNYIKFFARDQRGELYLCGSEKKRIFRIKRNVYMFHARTFKLCGKTSSAGGYRNVVPPRIKRLCKLKNVGFRTAYVHFHSAKKYFHFALRKKISLPKNIRE